MRIPHAAAEIRRVLAPGGRAWLTLHSLRFALAHAAPTWKSRVMWVYRLVSGLWFHCTLRVLPLAGRCESWQSATAMRRLLRRHGFEQIRVTQQWSR